MQKKKEEFFEKFDDMTKWSEPAEIWEHIAQLLAEKDKEFEDKLINFGKDPFEGLLFASDFETSKSLRIVEDMMPGLVENFIERKFNSPITNN